MKKLLYLFSVILLLALTFMILNSSHPIWWQNIKLNSTKFWGFTSISNNPLLPGSDADFSQTDYKDKEITPRIDTNRLFSGGPAKDQIPSIDDPQFEAISNTGFGDDELIIGLVINGDARAYPYAIMNWHEIVNDVVGGEPVAVTYCPLCETNSVFKRVLNGKAVEFGVSGKLYESCLVMFDRTSDSLYSQPWGVGIVGEETDTVLERVPAVRTTVGQWKEKYPDSKILTTDTGALRNYDQYPYGSYYTDRQVIFSVSRQDQLAVHPKEIGHIIFNHDENKTTNRFSGEYVYFTQAEVESAGELSFSMNGSEGKALWNSELGTIDFVNVDGQSIADMALFGFVYPAHFK